MIEALNEIQTGLEAAAGGGDGPAVQGETDPKADSTPGAGRDDAAGDKNDDATEQAKADLTGQDGRDDAAGDKNDAATGDKNDAATEQANEPKERPLATPQKRPASPNKEAEAAKNQTPLKRPKAATHLGGPAETAAARHRGNEAGGKPAAATATATLHE